MLDSNNIIAFSWCMHIYLVAGFVPVHIVMLFLIELIQYFKKANTMWLNPILTTDVMKLLSASLKEVQNTLDFAIYLFFSPLGYIFIPEPAGGQPSMPHMAKDGNWAAVKKWHHQNECDHVTVAENWEKWYFKKLLLFIKVSQNLNYVSPRRLLTQNKRPAA